MVRYTIWHDADTHHPCPSSERRGIRLPVCRRFSSSRACDFRLCGLMQEADGADLVIRSAVLPLGSQAADPRQGPRCRLSILQRLLFTVDAPARNC